MLMSPGYFQESLKGTWKAATKQSTLCGHHSWLLPCSLPVQLRLVLVSGCNDAPGGLTSAILMVPAENTNTDHPCPLATVLEGHRTVLGYLKRLGEQMPPTLCCTIF